MRKAFVVPVIMAAALAATMSSTRSSLAQSAADECLTKPGATAPQGSHWYYRVDRSDGRHCWYLGPEGAKTRASKRQVEPARSASRPELSTTTETAPDVATADAAADKDALARGAPAQGSPVQAGAAEALVASVAPRVTTDSDNGAAVEVAARWHQLPSSADAPAPGPVPASNNYVEERETEKSEDHMPLVWPILTPAEAAEPTRSAVNPEYVLALLVGALLLAAVIGRSIFVLLATRDRAPTDRHNVPRPRNPMPAGVADALMFVPPAVRRSSAEMRRLGLAGGHRTPRARPRVKPLDKPSDPAHDLEESLVRLLQAWQRAAA
jgi:hypothetical protein